MLLAGDIGGTKTILGVFTPENGPFSPLAEITYDSQGYPSLEVMASDFLKRTGLHVREGSFGVAGPIVDGRTVPTNLPWSIEGASVATALNLSQVHLINDLEAVAHGIPQLEKEDFQILNEGSARPNKTLAVIAPGTGLGEAFLVWDGKGYIACPSEGGHGDFAPSNSLERDLLDFLTETREHVSYETVCSGSGFLNIYDYLRIHEKMNVPDWLSRDLAQAPDPTAVIVDSALNPGRECYICRRTLDIFTSILGGKAGNLALTVLATGGVYLGGGIPPRILPALQCGSFMEAFKRKGRMSGIMRDIPVHVILNPKAALIGAAFIGLERMGKESGDRSQETDWLRFSH